MVGIASPNINVGLVIRQYNPNLSDNNLLQHLSPVIANTEHSLLFAIPFFYEHAPPAKINFGWGMFFYYYLLNATLGEQTWSHHRP
jgi:hypothetical protein